VNRLRPQIGAELRDGPGKAERFIVD